MKTKLFILFIALAIVGCEEKQESDDTPEVKPVLLVQPATISATAAGGSHTLAVTSNVAWTAMVEDAAAHAWCTITNGTTGSENGTITLQTAQYTVTEERYAIITVSAGTLTRQVTVTQAAAAPVLNVDKTAIDATVAANSYPINVTSNLTWAAAVNSGATWCTLPNATTGNGTLMVNVAENTLFTTRAATVTITSGTLTKTVAVTQAGVTPTLTTDKSAIDAIYNAGNYAIAVASNTAWTAEVNAGATWCTVQPATGTGTGAVLVAVTENLMAAQRSAIITFAAGTLTCATTVEQAAAEPTLAVNSTYLGAAETAGSYPIVVASNATWNASVNAEAAAWCTVTPTTGTGNGMLTVNIPAYTGSRSATVTVSAGTLTRSVAVMQQSTPYYAASTNTWVYGEQIWSDAIHVSPECDKTTFTSSTTDPQCRSYTTDTWYYYNWVYVDENKETMCPAPWRVPTLTDFNTLISNANYSMLGADWGYGGDGRGYDVNGGFWYWSSTIYPDDAAQRYYLYAPSSSRGLYTDHVTTNYIFQVRCVK
jgi:hypothetical protein